MNEAILATYDGYHPKDRNGQQPSRCSAGHALYLIDAIGGTERQVFLDSHAERRVREEKGCYVPDLSSGVEHDTKPDAHKAAMEHAKHLIEAQRLVGEALNLVGLALVSLGDEGDSRAMQMNAALGAIEHKLSKAYNGIDKHDARHSKLFLAYFNFKGEAAMGEQN